MSLEKLVEYDTIKYVRRITQSNLNDRINVIREETGYVMRLHLDELKSEYTLFACQKTSRGYDNTDILCTAKSPVVIDYYLHGFIVGYNIHKSRMACG